MKKITVRLCHITKPLTFIIPLLFLGTYIHAQPSWPAVAAGSNPNTWALTWATQNDIENISCDMYTDASPSTGPGNSAIVIVWDEYNPGGGGTWEVRAALYDARIAAFVWNRQLIATGARNPDVVFGETNAGVAGDVTVNIVYETTSNTVEYSEYQFTGLCVGTPMLTGSSTGNQFYGNSSSNPARNPRIDALPADIGWYTGAGVNTAYRPLRDYVVTWTEEVSSVDKIYINFEQFNTTPTTTSAQIYQVASGTESDIAGVLRNGTDIIAYLTYIDAGGDLVQEEWDMGSGTLIGATNTLESINTIVGKPRIDARNVDISTQRPLWGVISAVDIGGTNGEKIRYWDDNSGLFDFASTNPLSGSGLDEEGYRPAIGTGPGPDDYSGYTSDFGNLWYLMGFGISNTSTGSPHLMEDLLATAYDGVTFVGYDEIDANSNMAITGPPLAFSSSSNCGVGNLTAWTDDVGGDDVIFFCMTQGTTMAYKPGKPTSIVNTKPSYNYSAYPNPGADHVMVQGLKKEAFYVATDLAGREVLRGVASPSKQRIDISGLANGLYIFNFNEDGVHTQLKLVKQ